MVKDELLSPERWRPVHCSRWDGAGRPRVGPTCSSATCSPPAPTESSPALLQQGKPSVDTFLVNVSDCIMGNNNVHFLFPFYDFSSELFTFGSCSK